MITVSFNKGADFIEVRALGHALFDKKGSDIVCASVSVLIQSWYLSERELCGADVEIDQEQGIFRVKVKNCDAGELLLYKSLVLSLKTLESQYPENIRIEMEDINGGFRYSEKRAGKPV